MLPIIRYAPTKTVITERARLFLEKNYMLTGKREVQNAVEEFAGQTQNFTPKENLPILKQILNLFFPRTKVRTINTIDIKEVPMKQSVYSYGQYPVQRDPQTMKVLAIKSDKQVGKKIFEGDTVEFAGLGELKRQPEEAARISRSGNALNQINEEPQIKKQFLGKLK